MHKKQPVCHLFIIVRSSSMYLTQKLPFLTPPSSSDRRSRPFNLNSFLGSQIYPCHSTIVCITLFIYPTQKLPFLTSSSTSDRLSRPFKFFRWLSNLSWSFHHCFHNPFHLSNTDTPFPNPFIHRRSPFTTL